MDLKSCRVVDDYVVINESLYYKLSVLEQIRLDDGYLKLDRSSGSIGEWFNLRVYECDVLDLIAFVDSTNKLIKDAKSKDYLVIEWGMFFFLMLMLAVLSCSLGMIIGVGCGIHI